jgi:sodium/potassium/calcium exchanger 6
LILLYIVRSAISPYKKMVFVVPGVDFPLWSLVLLQGTILAAAYFILTKEPPKEELPIAVVSAFVMSVFWISFVAGELVGCLEALGVLLKLPPALLGLTVLAWGNSIGDLVADVAVARAGQPAMAMAGCFAGPMFNMLVGFGLALAVKTSRIYPKPYILEYNPSIVVAFFFLFASLVGSLVVVTCNKFRVPRLWGFWLIGLYIAFVLVSISNSS